MTEASASVFVSRRGWQTLFLFLLAVGVLILMYRLRAIFTPLFVAFLIAYIANPLVTALERRRVPRLATIVCLYAAFLVIGGLAAVFGIPAIVHQGSEFGRELIVGEPILERDPDGNIVRFKDFNANGLWDPPKIGPALAWIETRFQEFTETRDIVAELRNWITGKEADVAKTASAVLEKAFSWTTAGVSGVLAALSFVVLVPVYVFFLLKHMNRIWERTQAELPERHRDRIVRTLTRIHRANASFFRGQISIALIEGLILFVVLTALGVRFSLLFGVLYAVLAMIPYLGVTTMFAATTFFVLLDKGGFTATFFAVIGLFVFIQILEGFVLQPFILGKETGLHPMAIILSILIFGELFGFFGLLLAIPLASATIIVAQDYVVPVVREVTGSGKSA